MGQPGAWTDRLGSFGVWGHASSLTPAVARELERSGYGTLWIGGSPPADLMSVEAVLAATERVMVATGIVNIWTADASTVAASYHRLESAFPGRFLLGIGAGHREHIGDDYLSPLAALSSYLDVLDTEGVPTGRRLLAALGPKALRLAAERSAGAHPYLTTPKHTRFAREVLGAGPLLAPEHKVVIADDPERARSIGRPRVASPYLGLSNYVANLRRLGYDDIDLAGTGSDRLVDDLVAHGDSVTVASQLKGHLDAGADHVAVQLLTADGGDPLPGLRELAEAIA